MPETTSTSSSQPGVPGVSGGHPLTEAEVAGLAVAISVLVAWACVRLFGRSGPRPSDLT